MGDEPMSSDAHAASLSRPKLYHVARVPEHVTIVYPAFDESPEYKMCVCSSASRGAKLYIEFTQENLELNGCACPPPSMHRVFSG